MVFRAVPFARIPKKPGSSSYELRSPPELVVSASARSLSFPGAFHGVCFLFATSIQRVHLPASVPGSPTFRPQRFARSRRLTPRSILQIYFALLPRPGFRSGVVPPTQLHHLVGGHVLSPLVPCLYRRLPDDAKPRHVDLRTSFQVGIRSAARVFSPSHRPCPIALVSFGLLLPTLLRL